MFYSAKQKFAGAGRRLAFAAAAALAGSQALAADPHDLSGVWSNTLPTSRLVLPGGAAAPLNPAGKAAYDKAKAALKSGAAVDAVHKYCLPEGVPRLMFSAYPFEIVQAQQQLTIVHESHHTFRIVLMNGTHPSDDVAVPAFMGDSIGRWDGNVLVIDTTGFNSSAPLDASGLPHGEKLHVVERLRRTAQSALEDRITIDDPEFYSHPWTLRATYRLRPGRRIQEYVCGDPHPAQP